VVRISTNQFKPGITINYEGNLFEMIEYQFVKPGKGTAFVRTRIKNSRTGKVLEVTFDSNDTVEQVMVDKSDLEYLYREGDYFVFMDPTSFDQIHVAKEQIEHILPFLKENTTCLFKRAGEEILAISLPDFVVVKVIETEPNMKGATASGGPKPAKVETGATVMVPPFIKLGEMIRVDTRTSQYVDRA
jgi:elongation factor P